MNSTKSHGISNPDGTCPYGDKDCPKCQTNNTKEWKEKLKKFMEGVRMMRGHDYNSVVEGNEFLEDFIESLLSQTLKQRDSEWRETIEGMKTNYPIDIFPEPWDGWQKDINKLAEEKGRSIDCISAHYARWQEGIVKEDLLHIMELEG